jgi:general nucleoside transport system permease protein
VTGRERRRGVAVAAGAVLATGLASTLLLLLGGYDPLSAGGALLRGAFGSTDALLSVTLVRSVPLIFTGLAVALAFRAGVWNIGAEGQLYAGAVAGVWVGLNGGGLPAWVLAPAVLLAAAAAGAAWTVVPVLMRLRLGVGEVITTILMNFVGIHLAAYAVHGPLQEPRGVFPQTDQIAAAARLPPLVPGTRLHAGFGLAVVLAVALALVLRRTRLGFRIRAVGASEEAAAVAGRIDARRVVLVCFLGSGALAGLAGGVEVAGLTFALYEGLSPGWGYTAIAVALLAGLDPLAVLGTGVLFGALEAGAGAMQREAGIPAVWVIAVQALIILSVLALDQLLRRRWSWGGRGVSSSAPASPADSPPPDAGQEAPRD